MKIREGLIETLQNLLNGCRFSDFTTPKEDRALAEAIRLLKAMDRLLKQFHRIDERFERTKGPGYYRPFRVRHNGKRVSNKSSGSGAAPS